MNSSLVHLQPCGEHLIPTCAHDVKISIHRVYAIVNYLSSSYLGKCSIRIEAE